MSALVLIFAGYVSAYLFHPAKMCTMQIDWSWTWLLCRAQIRQSSCACWRDHRCLFSFFASLRHKPQGCRVQSAVIREVKRIHEARRVRVRPTSLVKHSWRVEKRLSHWWRHRDESQTNVTSKKMAHRRLPGSTSKLLATTYNCNGPPSRGGGRMDRRRSTFSGFAVILIWWFSSKGKWKSKKTE